MPKSVVILVDPSPEALSAGEAILGAASIDFISSLELAEALRYVSPDHHIRAIVIDATEARLDRLVQSVQLTGQRIPFIILVPPGESRGVAEALEAARWHDLIEIAAVLEKPLSDERLLQAVLSARHHPRASQRPELEIHEEDDPLGDIEIHIEEEIDEDPTVVDHIASLVPRELLIELSQSAASEPPPPPEPHASTELRMRATMLAQRVLSSLPRSFLASESSDITELMTRACELALAEQELTRGVPADLERTVQTRRPSDLSAAMSGDIAYLSVDQIIQMIASLHAPASVRLEREGRSVEIFFQEGRIVFARQSNLREDFLIGRFIADTGAITQHEVEEILKRSSGPRTPLGQQLRELGWIAQRDLEQALERQTAELVYEALRWTSGRFFVFAQERLPPEAEDAAMSFPVQHLLLEGVRRLDEWRRMTGQGAGEGLAN